MILSLDSKIRTGIFIVVALSAFPLYHFTEAGLDTFRLMVPLIVLMQCYLCYSLRNVAAFMFLTIYAFIYFIYLIPYFYYGMQLSMWSEFQSRKLYMEVCLQFYIFYSALCLSVRKGINPDKRWLKTDLMLDVKPVIQMVAVMVTLFTVVYLYKFGGENVLMSNNPWEAYKDNLEKSNVLGLLVVMFIAFSYFVIKNRKNRNIFVLVSLGLIGYYAITRGFRVMIAPAGFLFLLLFLEQKLTVKGIVLLALLGLIGLGYVNSLKMSEDFSLMYVFSTDDSFILSHQADELYGAAVANGLVENGEISFWDRVALQMSLISQAVVPPSFFPNSMRFPMVLMLHTGTGGGGLFVSGITLIFGYIGLFIVTFLLSKLIQAGYSTKNRYLKLVVFLILLYSPNWFSYDLNVILRFPIIGIVLYYLIQKIKLPNLKWQIS